MKVEVEFTCDLDPDHPDWPEVTWCEVLISEDDLPLDKDTLRRLRITPAKLREVFAEARELAKDIKPGDRVRICADRGRANDDDFFVVPVRYSSLSDPMLQEVKGKVQ
jgi:hypothetical protein